MMQSREFQGSESKFAFSLPRRSLITPSSPSSRVSRLAFILAFFSSDGPDIPNSEVGDGLSK